MTEAQFRQLVCDRMSALLSCNARLMIDVRRFDNFAGIATPPALDATGKARRLSATTAFRNESFSRDPHALLQTLRQIRKRRLGH